MKDRKKIITDVTSPSGVRHRLKWFANKAAAAECKRRLGEISEYKQAGRVLSGEMRNWLERLPQDRLKRLHELEFIGDDDVHQGARRDHASRSDFHHHENLYPCGTCGAVRSFGVFTQSDDALG